MEEVNRSFSFNLYDYERNVEMQNEYVLVIVRHPSNSKTSIQVIRLCSLDDEVSLPTLSLLWAVRRDFFGGELPQFLCNINMIPPCDPSILEHNPQFKRLYENLTTSILNPDASTRAQSASPARTAVVEVSSHYAAHTKWT